MKKKIILFGAGKNGRLALKKYGKENVAYFADNAKEKQGTSVEGVEVISFSKMLELHKEGYVIMITLENPAYLIGQLEMADVKDYLVYRSEERVHYLETMKRYEEEYLEANAYLDNLVEEARKIDIIADFEAFRKIATDVVKKGKEEGVSLRRQGFGFEGDLYGNVSGLISFAELPKDAKMYFPTVSHQDCFPLYTPAFMYKTAVVFSGDYYKEKVHERAPYVPVFSVGPYINYVKGIYDEEKVARLKKENGKTLLIFLPHSIERVDRKYDKRDFIDKILDAYTNQFDKIMMCVYWADINEPVCDYAIECGIKVVSAGFRFDTEFDRRLRTIIELSDAVVCGDIGTHIAYSISLGKPIARVSISDNQKIADGEVNSEMERMLQFSDDHREFDEGFFHFFDEEIKSTPEQKAWMNLVSGFDRIRDKEYIRNIYTISKDLWLACEGDTNNYPAAVQNIYLKYEKELDFERLCMLKEAVGDYLN